MTQDALFLVAPSVAPSRVSGTVPDDTTESAVGCAHCGAALSRAPERDAKGRGFCCSGCRTVFGLIAECQLSDYYAERDRLASEARPARTTSQAYDEFDHPDFLAEHLRVDPSGVAQLELALEGIHCAACVWLVERLPRVLPEVREARLDFGRAIVSVRFDTTELKPSRVARALDSLGYPTHALGSAAREQEQTRADRALLLKLGVAFAAAGNVMLMSFALYSGAEGSYGALFRWGSWLITLPTVAFSGSVFFRGAWAAVRTRTPHMDLPVAIGILAGTLWGSVNTWLGRGEVYFDTLTVLTFLLLVGRWLGQRQRRQAARATELFAALAPATARLVDPGVEGPRLATVPARSVVVDSVVEVRPGERIPVDGVVVHGASHLDAATLTGESRPQTVSIGDRVYASTLNLESTLRVRCEAAGDATRVGRLMHSVEQAQRDRPPLVKTADRVAGVLVYAVLGLALLTALVWLTLDPSRAVDHAIALLVVTCPCALGMATPLSVSAALARAAKAGLLFKGGEFVEVLARPALFVLDKTGTLTEGRPELVQFDGPQEFKAWVKAAEARSEHPIARAFARAWADCPELEAEDGRCVAGGGVRARVASHDVIVGSAAWVESELRQHGSSPALPEEIRARVARYARSGSTPVVIAIDGVACASAAFADRLRPDSAESLRALSGLGARFLVLSGDHPDVVRETADALGVPLLGARGGLSPEQKHAEIVRLRELGERVVMVGDGVNDAAALSAASCGFAVHGGAEASLIAADVFATESGLRPLQCAVQGSIRTLDTIRRGIVFSLIYNLLGVALAMAGLLTPLWAAVLMPLSSLTVVTNALKSRSFERT